MMDKSPTTIWGLGSPIKLEDSSSFFFCATNFQLPKKSKILNLGSGLGLPPNLSLRSKLSKISNSSNFQYLKFISDHRIKNGRMRCFAQFAPQAGNRR